MNVLNFFQLSRDYIGQIIKFLPLLFYHINTASKISPYPSCVEIHVHALIIRKVPTYIPVYFCFIMSITYFNKSLNLWTLPCEGYVFGFVSTSMILTTSLIVSVVHFMLKTDSGLKGSRFCISAKGMLVSNNAEKIPIRIC